MLPHDKEGGTSDSAGLGEADIPTAVNNGTDCGDEVVGHGAGVGLTIGGLEVITKPCEGVIEKRLNGSGRQTTEYRLTQAGQELLDIVAALRVWGATWAFGEPTPEELNPVLLMWWLRKRVNVAQLPDHRVVMQFDFHGAARATFWLILTTDDVSICLTDPGYELNVLVSGNLAVFFKLWAERISYQEALNDYDISVEGIPSLIRAFPDWFGWSIAASVERNNYRAAQQIVALEA
jgi:hypothetical protein